MILVFDADILSTLLKSESQKFLRKLHPRANFIVPKSVLAELERGFFQGKKLSTLLDKRIFKVKKVREADIRKLKKIRKKLHSGEIAAIALAKKLKTTFLSNDQVALKVAKRQGVKTQSLKQLLIALAKEKIVRKAQMIKLLRDIEEKDYTIVLGQEDILKAYD